jgi:hypothetical protein
MFALLAKQYPSLKLYGITGAGCKIRTRDPLITNQVLYQLS